MTISILFIFLLFSSHLCHAYGGRILVSYALGSASHLRSMMPLIEKLVNAGHNVTIFDVQPTNQGRLVMHPNISRLSVGLTVRNTTHAKMADLLWRRDYAGAFMAITAYFSLMANEQIFHNHAKELYTVMRHDFDLVLVDEFFNEYGFLFADHFHKQYGVPYVIFGPTITTTNDDYYLGSGRNWANTPPLAPGAPSFFDEKYVFMSFFTRLRGFLDAFVELILMFVYDWQWRGIFGKRLGVANFNNFEFIPNSNLFLTDDLYRIGFTKPRVSNLLPVGAHCSKSGLLLDDDILAFLEDKSSKGTIYVSFGTYVNWNLAPLAVLQALLKTFAAMRDYRFILAAYDGPRVNASSNVRIMNWIPQAAILAHPRTKVFLMHGGIKSVKEAICAEVPMLVMPMTFDQGRLAHVVTHRGLGGAYNKHRISAQSLVRDLTRLLADNDAYKRRVGRLRAAFVDRPLADLDAAEFYVSRLIRLFETRNKTIHKRDVNLFRKNRSTTMAFYEFTYMIHVCILVVICYCLSLSVF